MADGSARQHDIVMKTRDEQFWSQRMRNKWECHIKQQDVDTFFVTITTIHPGSHNWIRSYLLKWNGNYFCIRNMWHEIHGVKLNPYIQNIGYHYPK